MQSINITAQVYDTYQKSRQRYLEYYLKLPKVANANALELEAEIPNLQYAFNWALWAGNNELLLNFWNNLKDFLWDRGHWQVFLEWGDKTLRALQQLKSPTDEAWVLSELGWFWMEQDESHTAQEMFERSRNIFASINHYEGICAIERYLGVLAYRMGDLDQAQKRYEIALQIALTRDLTGMIAEIRNQQGSVARKTGDFIRARQLYEEAKKEIEQQGDKWRLTGILRNLARLEFQTENFAAAKDGFMETIELCKQINRRDMLYGCQLRLAEVELELGNIEKARELAISARKGFAELGMKRDLQTTNQFLDTLSSLA
jgi:tetratricopeptide (TPR) repeat protein